jgi:thiosulfate reductase cytochrome b subunit
MIAATGMAEPAYFPAVAIHTAKRKRRIKPNAPRHSALVRVTHWITTLSFLGLLVSGVAILLAHPRLYWGETGTAGTPALIDLPLPLLLGGQSGWGRYLHFLSAWVLVLTGLLYLVSGLATGHFYRNLLPSRAGWKRPSEDAFLTYRALQKLTYLAVVFLLFPLMIWTGLAMSPAVTSVFPELVTVFGGQQSARTIHFLITNILVLFLAVHIAMVAVSGFARRMRAMITGKA